VVLLTVGNSIAYNDMTSGREDKIRPLFCEKVTQSKIDMVNEFPMCDFTGL